MHIRLSGGRDGPPQLGPGEPELGQGSPELGRGNPELGRGIPDLGQGNPDLGRGNHKFHFFFRLIASCPLAFSDFFI